jgi:hypothetical protein
MKIFVAWLAAILACSCLSRTDATAVSQRGDFDILDTLRDTGEFSIRFSPNGILTQKKYIHYYPDTVMVNTDLHADDTILSIVNEAQHGISGAVADPNGEFILKVKGKEYRYRYDYDVPFIRKVTDYIDTKTAWKYQVHPKD